MEEGKFTDHIFLRMKGVSDGLQQEEKEGHNGLFRQPNFMLVKILSNGNSSVEGGRKE
jgi:hypothetical protein